MKKNHNGNPEKDKEEEIKENEEITKEEEIEEEAVTHSGEEETDENKEEEEETEADKIRKELDAQKEKYLRLSAEFDNYRKRTLKERMELMKSAGEDIFLNILPVMDNFERALNSMEEAKDVDAVKEGVVLIYNKFREFLSQRGIKEIEAVNKEFDTDVHEAVTKIPAPKKKMVGKVLDVIEKGYFLNDKVIRFAKVVVGE